MSDDSKKTFECKVVFLGASAVGKSSILLQYTTNTFDPNMQTTPGANYMKKEKIFPDGTKLIFELWDTAGQEKYRALARSFLNNAGICLLIYDITSRETFEEIKNYYINMIKDSASSDIGKI